jgi:ABC-type enterochelin transport system substrate-binding protein
MARLLAETRTNQDKTDANLKEMKAEMMAKMEVEMKTDQERMEAIIDANNEKVLVLRNKMWTSQEEMKVMLEACLEKMTANPGKMKSVV